MNARLETNVLRGWKPGWRTGIAHNIAITSDVPKRRKRRSNAGAYVIAAALLGLAWAVVAYA